MTQTTAPQSLEERAKHLWPHSDLYQRSWIAMVALLGPKWLLFKPFNR